MTKRDVETKRLELLGVLTETSQLLRRHGENHWSEKLDQSRRLIEKQLEKIDQR